MPGEFAVRHWVPIEMSWDFAGGPNPLVPPSRVR
jgi:hypothetical protein